LMALTGGGPTFRSVRYALKTVGVPAVTHLLFVATFV